MRRILVIAAALGMMWSLRALSLERTEGSVDPSTLAAIGFVLLAAFIFGEVVASLRIPKITGYIVAGVVLGPHLSDILSHRVVEELGVFNTLALGLIATTAGLELDLKAIAKVWRTLAVTVLVKLPVLLLAVGGSFWIVQTHVPVLDIESPSAVVALALIFAVLGIGTSPAIVLAVIRESHAKGRLSDLVLAMAVVKDLVVVVCLALAIAVARSLLVPEGAVDARIVVPVAEELGLSLGVGLGVGLVVILYLRFVRREMLLFAAVTVLLAAEVTRWLHLEMLLVLITAGFVVRNLSRHERELLEALQRVALPVFVVFFTAAGADVDLGTTIAVLPLALVLVVARATSFAVAGVLGGHAGGESRAVRRNAWMAYIPQAGVTLGLVFLAAEALPEVAPQIRQTGMAVVAFNLLFGPLLLSAALRRVGDVVARRPAPSIELAERTPGEPADHDEGVAGDADEAVGPIDVDIDVEPAGMAETPAPTPATSTIAARLDDASLRRILTSIGDAVEARVRAFIDDEVVDLERTGHGMCRVLLGEAEPTSKVATVVAAALEMSPPVTPSRWEDGALRLFREIAATVQSLPIELKVPIRAELLAKDARDRALLSLKKLGARHFLRERRLPVRLIARTAFEGRFAEAVAVVTASWFKTYGDALGIVGATVRGSLEPDVARHAVESAFTTWRVEVGRDLDHALHRGLEVLADGLATAGLPGHRRDDFRYSIVEPQVRRALATIDADRAPWRACVAAAFDSLRAGAAVEACEASLDGVLERHAWTPLENVHERLFPVLLALSTSLEAARSKAAIAGDIDDAELEDLLLSARSSLKDEQKAVVRKARAAFRRLTRKNHVVAELAEIVAAAPGRLEVISHGFTLRDAQRPSDVGTLTVEFAKEIERPLAEILLPRVTGALSEVLTLVASYEARLLESIHIATYGIETALRRKLDEDRGRRDLATAALERAAGRCRELVAELESTLAEALRQVDDGREATLQQLRRLLEGRAATERVKDTVRSRARALAVTWANRSRDLTRALLGFTRRARRRLAKQRQVQDWLIAAGRKQLDANEMARYVRERLPRPETLGLPQLFSQAFSTAPVDDRRLLAVYRVEAEKAATALSNERGHNVLVLAGPGTGSTSLLNELEYKLSDRPVLRIDGALHSRSEGILGALALELGCDRMEEAIVDALHATPRLVMIDDIEHLVSPTPAGLDAFEQFLHVVVDTTEATRWVATTSREALRVLGSTTIPITEAFGCHVDLGPLGWRDLREVMSARHRLAGVSVSYRSFPAALGTAFRWRRRLEEEIYYRSLARVSNGVLRAALLAHVQSVRPLAETGAYGVELPERSVLPFLGQLQSTPVAALAVLCRFGPMSLAELAACLDIEERTLRGHTAFLEAAKLLERRIWADGTALAIPSHVEDTLTNGLRDLHVLGEVG